MIASICGRVLAAGAGWAVVGVGGVGLRVEVPSGRTSQFVVGDEVALHTSLVVRDDSFTLFGFETSDELEVFGHLIAVSGVGPRSALGVLSAVSPAQIARAVADEDESPFRRVSGIGPKTAKMLLVSLAGKLAGFEGDDGVGVGVEGDAGEAVAVAVRDGLVGLGWGESEAWQAVKDAREAGASDDSAQLLRAALALLQGSRKVLR